MEKELEIKNKEFALSGSVVDLRNGVIDRSAEHKIWGFFRKDLVLSAGKMGAQAGHAFGTCMIMTERRSPEIIDTYLSEGQPKISIGVSGEDELLKMVTLCRELGLVVSLVQDAGRTELEGKVFTAGAVGPCLKSDLPKKVQRLQLFKGVFKSDN